MSDLDPSLAIEESLVADAAPLATDAPAAVPPPPSPRIRVGAVLWGLVLLAVAGVTLWLSTSPTRRADALAAVLGLDGFGWTIVGVIVIGGILTLVALAAVVRQGQARLAARRMR